VLFNKYIEVDCDARESDCEKENQKQVKVSKANTKKVQFNKLDSFMKEYSNSQMDKDEFNKLWNALVIELNSHGPPNFTAQEWKAKWSQHKYNRKRKRNIIDIPGLSCQVPVIETLARETDILDKLDVIIQKEGAILDKLEVINQKRGCHIG